MRFGGACSVVALVAATMTIDVGDAHQVDAAACEASALDSPAGEPAPATGFHAMTPIRLLDTRDTGTSVRAGCTIALDVGNTPTVPDDAEALALNVTTVDATARGFVTVYPCSSRRPDASSVNTRVGGATASSVLVGLDASRLVCIYTQASAHVVVDLTGWFGRFGAPYNAVSSARVLDTRTTLRPDAGSDLVPARTELQLVLAGDSVPAAARAVAVNITTTDGLAPGFVSVYPCGQRPETSTVNFAAVDQRANHALIGLDDDGALCVWTNEAVHIIIDLEGWFGRESNAVANGDAGAMFRALVGSRVLDTRNNTGGVTGPIAVGTTVAFDPADSGRLRLGSTVALNVVATEAASAGYVTLFACSEGEPPTSSVNTVAGTEASNVAFVTVDADSKVCVFASTTTHVVVDVIGTFGPGGPLHELTISQPALGQVFAADSHDYTVLCHAGTNSLTVHAVGAPGTTVSIAPSTASPPTSSERTVDATFNVQENDALVVRAGVVGAAPEEYWVRCLPHDFPTIRVTRTDAPTPGWYLADAAFPASGGDPSRYLMILDGRSVPVWYHRVASPSIDLTRMSDGTLAWTKLLGLAFGSTPGGVFEIHRLDGSLVRAISTVSGPTDHHDIAELPNGDVVLATYVARQHVDLTSLGAGFGSDELVYDSHLEQIRPDGTVAWTWKSEDHIPTSASTFAQRLPGLAGLGVDLVHVNSIHVAPDGDLIVSARHTDTVYKVRRNPAGDVVWRLGGTQSDFTFVDDPLGGIGRQHDAQLLADGNLRLFDNRTALVGAPRAVEYALDTSQHTARLVWSASTPAVTSSGGVGSVRTLGDGDFVVTWGGSSAPGFTEFGSQSRELQSTTVIGHYAYRVDKQPIDAFDINVLRATAGR